MSYRDFFYKFRIRAKWMKWIEKFISLPDLTFGGYDINYMDDTLSLKVKVKNIGLSKSGKTFLYLNAIDTIPPPGQNEIRIQYKKNIPELEYNEEIEITLTIANTDLEQNEINRIDILIDPKNLVREINESNNILILGI